MMKKIGFVLSIMILSLYAKNSTVDCNKIFDLRKQEIVRELQEIEESKQSLEALKNANESLFSKKELQLSNREENLSSERQKVDAIKKETLATFEKNKVLLQDIKKAKDDKISSAYLKMKDAKAAAILDKMKAHEAALILFNLTAKKIAKIMAKMEPMHASIITKLLHQGPPFKEVLEE
jgi:flagellar motility protein MotE (MotC chaperone)